MATTTALATVQKLYIAYYGRPADPAGQLFWADKLDAARGSLAGITDAFANSAEAQALYGAAGTTHAGRVKVLYQNILGRPPETAGLNYYVDLLNRGKLSLVNAALAILDGAQGTDLTLLQQRENAAAQFTAALDLPQEQAAYVGPAKAQMAREALASITAEANTLSAFTNGLNALVFKIQGGQLVQGHVSAGPVVENHGLQVTAYDAQGNVLGSGALDPDGSYRITIERNYSGPILVRVVDTSAGADYVDEARGQPVDLTSDLRALSTVNGAGTYTVNINPITELIARRAGLQGGDNATSQLGLGNTTPAQIQQATQDIASALGLGNINPMTTTPVTTVTATGSANPAANTVGRVLAAISGQEHGQSVSTHQVLNTILGNLTGTGPQTQLSPTGQRDLLIGAATSDLNGTVGVTASLAQNLGTPANTAAQIQHAIKQLTDLADKRITTTTLTPADFAAIGVTGVTNANLNTVLEQVAKQPGGSTATNSLAEIQTVVSNTSAPAPAPEPDPGPPADTTAPTVSSIAITSATGIQASTLNAGDLLSVTLTMSEATTVTGTPLLALNIGSTTVQASYGSGSGSTALLFTYTILAGQMDTNGIRIDANSLTLNGGTLKDAAGNNAVLTHAAVTDNSGYKVDTTADATTNPDAQVSVSAGAMYVNPSNKAVFPYTITGLDADTTATVTFTDSTQTTPLTVTATQTANGAFTADLSNLAEGSIALSITVTDTAGNTASGTGYTATKDTVVPAAPTAVAEHTTTVLSDTYWNDAEGSATIRVSLNTTATNGTQAKAGDTVELLLGGASFGTAKTASLTATNISDGHVEFSVAKTDLGAEGVTSLTAKVIDAASNAGTASTAAATFTLDTTAPTAAATITALSADTGTSATDYITNTAAQTVSGTYTGTLGSGEKIQVSADGTTWVDTTVTPATAPATGGTFSAANVTLTASGTALSVRTIDTAGNTTAGTGHSYTLDTTSPTMSSAAVSANGTSLVITYSEAVAGTLEAGDYAFSVGGVAYSGTISAPTIGTGADTNKVTLTLSSAIQAGATASNLVYTATAGTPDSVKDVVANNPAATQTLTTVTNGSTFDTVAPTMISATYDGTSVVITYSEALTGLAEAGDYTIITGSGFTVSVTAAAIGTGQSNNKVSLTLSTAIPNNATVNSIRYSSISGAYNSIKDAATPANPALNQTLRTNIAPLPAAATKNPIFAQYAVLAGDPNVYVTDDTITIQFNKPVAVANIAMADLVLSNSHSFGASTLDAVGATGGYASTFKVTLAADSTAAKDDVLTLNKAKVVDADGFVATNDVTFTLPSRANHVTGTTGNDTLVTTAVPDSMTGKTGNDIFDLSTVANWSASDVITDFGTNAVHNTPITNAAISITGDILKFSLASLAAISGYVALTTTPPTGSNGSTLASGDFGSVTTASGGTVTANVAHAQFIFDSTTTAVYFDADGTGTNASPVQVVGSIGYTGLGPNMILLVA